MEQCKLFSMAMLFAMCIFYIMLQGVQALPAGAPALYVFGDSTADVGNNNYRSTYAKCNFSPYGRDLPSGRATGRCSNGRLAIDYLSDDLGFNRFPSPYFADQSGDSAGPGINFASSTHVIDYNGPHSGQDFTLSDQITLFQQNTVPSLVKILDGSTAKAAAHLASSIFYISHGTDHWVQNLFVSDSKVSNGRLASTILGHVSDTLAALYGSGARVFVVMEMPAIGCMPYVMQASNAADGGCVADINDAVKSVFNDNLERLLARFVQSNAGAQIFGARSFGTTHRASKEPGTYGFTANEACCGSGAFKGAAPCNEGNACPNSESYPWWDGLHSSQHVQHAIEQEIVKLSPI